MYFWRLISFINGKYSGVLSAKSGLHQAELA